LSIHVLGDVHLGKQFQHGVPLHRRGDREKMQFAQFVADLDTECDIHIQVGDLFDKMFVSYSVIYAAYEAYRDACGRASPPLYVVMRGNHDASRDADKISAFQVFAAMVRPLGVVVVDDEAAQFADNICVVPWHPFKTAIEMLPQDLTGKTVYGHWDIVMGDTNQIPAAELKARGAVRAVTGHDHNARLMEIDGLPVAVAGSMQPYSHAEDPTGVMYKTLTLSELDEWGLTLHDCCVRLVLAPGEVLDFPVDCLQLQVQRGTAEVIDEQVDFEEFDFDHLWDLATVDLTPEMKITARGRLDEART
jgi:DNA repair exonuclease SbcCD nuclease subunit